MKKVQTSYCITDCSPLDHGDQEECACLFCTNELVLRERFRVETPLGYGEFSELYKAWDITTRKYVAVKRCSPGVSTARTVLRAEAATLVPLHHPKLPQFEAFLDDTYLVEELFDGIPLSQLLKERVQLTEQEVRILLMELLEVLQYLHGEGVVHQDIRPENVLVNKEGRLLALIDFGLAQREGVDSPGSTIFAETFAAPERYQLQRSTPAVDVFSVGILAQVCLIGDHQFRDLEQPWQWHLNGNFVSEEFVQLLERITSDSPAHRPAVREIMQLIACLPPVESIKVPLIQRLPLNGYSLSMHPTAFQVAVTTFDGDIQIVDVESGLAQKISMNEEFLVSRFSPDGRLLVAGGAEGGMYVWEEGMKLAHVMSEHKDSIQDAAFSKEGVLVTAAIDGELIVWDCASWTPRKRLRSHKGIRSVTVSDDAQLVAAVDESGELYMWNSSRLKRLHSYHSGVTAVCFSPDSHTLLIGYEDGTIATWRDHSLKMLHSSHLSEGQAAVKGLVFGTKGELIACREDSLILRMNIQEDRLVSIFHHSGHPVAIAEAMGRVVTAGFGSVQILP